jgi:SAM-dependent methyltransferase
MSNQQEMSCYLCGSTKCSMIHDNIRYNMSPRPFRCDQCGFVFLYPRMTPEIEKEFYKKTYRSTYDKQDAEKLWEASMPEAKNRVSRFMDLYSKDVRILEVGCASGYFLFAVKKHVKSVTGVELTKDFVKYARGKGLDVRESLDEVPDHSCDLIFVYHVLEHIEDPIRFLKDVKKKLSQSGKLIIEVPNVDDVLVSAYKIKNHLDFYWEIAHKYYFSKDSLRQVLDRAGYTSEICPLQRYDLSNHMYWMQYGKPGGQGFYGTLFTPSLLAEYEKCLKEKFICDTIYAIAERKD